MQISAGTRQSDIEYSIALPDGENYPISITRKGCADLVAQDIGEFIFLFEKDMTMEVQRIRSDLLFIHSAALAYQGRGLLLVAPSGTGKSTTSWAMLNSGFSYMSDELAPLAPGTLLIHPYPHALCLKGEPPLFALPENSLMTTRTIHVPVELSGGGECLAPVTLKYIFYLEFDEDIAEPDIRKISTAEASAKLYSNSLNILAHEKGEHGILAAISVAKQTENYALKSNHLDKTCEQMKILMDNN